VKGLGKRKVSLVVFGHMHKDLQSNFGCRKMIAEKDGLVHLNAAVVPRIRFPKLQGAGLEVSPHSRAIESLLKQVQDSNWLSEPNPLPSERNFTVVDMVNLEPKKIVEVWVKVTESDACVGEQTLLYSRD
jgi:hypothetical protein